MRTLNASFMPHSIQASRVFVYWYELMANTPPLGAAR